MEMTLWMSALSVVMSLFLVLVLPGKLIRSPPMVCRTRLGLAFLGLSAPMMLRKVAFCWDE